MIGGLLKLKSVQNLHRLIAMVILALPLTISTTSFVPGLFFIITFEPFRSLVTS